MVEHIIVGIDDSGPSRAALRWALLRAESTDAEVVLEHVVDDEWGQLGADYAQQETREGDRLLAEIQRQLVPAGRDVTVTLTHGSPAWTLAREAPPEALLVVGSHKTGYLRGRVLGTRSIVIASVARCTVVVVPEDNLSHRHGVVVGVAAGPQSNAAIVAGAREAKRLTQELSLIHVAPDASESAAAAHEVLARAAELAASTAPEITIRRRVFHRHCSTSLLDASRSALLLVLGASRADSDHAGFIGSVTHEVLLNLNAPVMVAR